MDIDRWYTNVYVFSEFVKMSNSQINYRRLTTKQIHVRDYSDSNPLKNTFIFCFYINSVNVFSSSHWLLSLSLSHDNTNFPFLQKNNILIFMYLRCTTHKVLLACCRGRLGTQSGIVYSCSTSNIMHRTPSPKFFRGCLFPV